MSDWAEDQFSRWELDKILWAYPGLSLRPFVNGVVRLSGRLVFVADADGLPRIADVYEVEITAPPGFPRDLPVVKETAGRIPKSFHTNGDGSLCLGSPVRLRLTICRQPTLLGFLERCVIPFLYGFSYREKHGVLPFGELDHGSKGLRHDFAELFGLENHDAVTGMVECASIKKRDANKRPCPCGSGRRLGKCHNRRINALRKQLGRSWFREQCLALAGK
jgi:hypothetical protein